MQTIDNTREGDAWRGDTTGLSTSDHRTLDALYRHPTAHNLKWKDVVALFNSLGTVEHRSNDETSIRIGVEHQLLHRPHGKDLTLDEVMELRQFLARSGRPSQEEGETAGTDDMLVTIDHHEAKIYRMDLRSSDAADHVIRPHDPHHFLHHLTHKDQSRERGQRAPEDPTFYERISKALAVAVPQGKIIVVGHGKGHSDAAHHLVMWLQHHHNETFQRLAGEVTANLSTITPAQILALGRDALTS